MDWGLDFSNQLDTAASLGHMEMVRLLLKRAFFGDEKARNEKINSAFFEAVRAGKVDAMVLLVDRGADVTYVSGEGITAVHCTAENGLCSALDILIKNGADVNVRSAEGITPLHLAAKHDQFSALELLIDNGAYINATSDNLFLLFTTLIYTNETRKDKNKVVRSKFLRTLTDHHTSCVWS